MQKLRLSFEHGLGSDGTGGYVNFLGKAFYGKEAIDGVGTRYHISLDIHGQHRFGNLVDHVVSLADMAMRNFQQCSDSIKI